MTKPVYIGCDDSGFSAKLDLMEYLDSREIPYVDCGSGEQPSRYPYFAARVASAVASGTADRGILICGSGIGMSIAANKYKGVRAAAITDAYSARLTRRHNDSNVLCLGGRVLGAWTLRNIVEVWLNTEYDGGHHQGSLELISAMEEINMTGESWCPEEQPYEAFEWNKSQKL